MVVVIIIDIDINMLNMGLMPSRCIEIEILITKKNGTRFSRRGISAWRLDKRIIAISLYIKLIMYDQDIFFYNKMRESCGAQAIAGFFMIDVCDVDQKYFQSILFYAKNIISPLCYHYNSSYASVFL